MHTLLIDIETYSSADIKHGVYKYVEAEDFAIQLFCYSIDYGPAILVDLACGEELPDEILKALTDAGIRKMAHNMVFEITCISRYFSIDLDVPQWWDTMAYGAYLGLPLSLDQLGKVLDLQKKKLDTGKNLIAFFSKPATNGKRRMPDDNKEKWLQYKDYCIRDVEAEVEVARFLEKKITVPSWERELQIADYNINKRGVRIDDTLARNAVSFWNRISEELRSRVRKITGLENPDSIQQLKSWFSRHGLKASSLDKAAMTEYLTRTLLPKVKEVILLRRDLGKTSVKKYEAMLNCQCADGRAHGITQYYGTFTGRWAGRMIQTQNLPQNHLADLDHARSLLRSGAFEEMDMEYDSIPDTLSQLIRTALIPSDGNVFHVCDFSAIEARVTAWLSGEQWVLDTFVNGGDIYCVTASRMFGVEVIKHGEHGHLRQPGKVAVLACGYGGGPAAFDSMAKNYGLHFTEKEKVDYVRQWRKANPNTVRLWSTMERAAMAAIQTGKTIAINRGLRFSYKYGCLFIMLPSGRSLCYPRAKVVAGEKGDRITYERQSQTTKNWELSDTYGGRLTENCVQAIARDILGVVILRCEERGYNIVFHVHDEVIVDAPQDVKLEDIESSFSEPIEWAKGLPLMGSGYICNYYFKD